MTRGRAAFSLIEVVVAVSVVAVMMSIVIPAVIAARGSARRSTCQNKVRQLGVAMAAFETSHRHFPSGKTTVSRTQNQFSWTAQLLPFLEQKPLWTQLKEAGDTLADDGQPAVGMAVLLSAVQCPSDPATSRLQRSSKRNGTYVALSDYLGVAGRNHLTQDGAFFLNSKTTIGAIRDGLSNTLFAGERPPSSDNNFGAWFTGLGQDGTGSLDLFLGVEELNSRRVTPLSEFSPGPYHFRRGTPQALESVFHFWSHHSGGANFLFGDGSVRMLSYETSTEVMREMATTSRQEAE